MIKKQIKGSCENCGFNYKGKVTLLENGSFPEIHCPGCGKETHNFDSAKEVEANDKFEGKVTYYKESVLK